MGRNKNRGRDASDNSAGMKSLEEDTEFVGVGGSVIPREEETQDTTEEETQDTAEEETAEEETAEEEKETPMVTQETTEDTKLANVEVPPEKTRAQETQEIIDAVLAAVAPSLNKAEGPVQSDSVLDALNEIARQLRIANGIRLADLLGSKSPAERARILNMYETYTVL